MALSVEWVGIGPAADRRLVERVGELQRGDPLAPVWVVVRAPVVALYLRRLFGERGRAYAGVRFSTLGRLIETVGGSAGGLQGRVPLDSVALEAACRAELAGLSRTGASSSVGAPAPPASWLASVADHPATGSSLASSYRALSCLDPDAVARLERVSSRAGEVVRLVSAVRRRLGPSYFDLSDLVGGALAAIGDGGTSTEDVGAVILHLPDPIAALEGRFVSALATRAEVVVMAGASGDERANAGLRRSVAKLGWSASGGSSAIDGTPAMADPGPKAPHVAGLVSLPDLDEEVRQAVRHLVAHAAAGGDLGRCAVTFPRAAAAMGYAGRLRQAMQAAGLPCCGTDGTLDEEPAAALVLALARLAAAGEDDLELDRHEVISLLGSGALDTTSFLFAGLPHLLCRGGTGRRGRPAVGALDRCSRAAGVVSGLGEWTGRLRSYARSAERYLVPGAPPETATDLALFVERLAGTLTEARRAGDWLSMARWASGTASRVVRPSPARDAVLDSLKGLDRLDRIEPVGNLSPAARCGRLVSALEVAFKRQAPSAGVSFGIGPLVGSLEAVDGVGTELTLVLGFAEGALPGRQSDDPLLPNRERDRVDGAGELERADERDRRRLMSVLASSSRTVATVPRTAPGRRSVMPSRWLDDLCPAGRAESVASFAASVAKVASGEEHPADISDYELASLELWRRAGEAPGAHYLLAAGDLAERADRERERRRCRGLGRFAGDLTGVAGDLGLSRVWDRPFSPTTLEELATCPFRFMLRHLLEVSPLPAPEELETIDARVRGSAMHEILEEFFRPFVGGTEPGGRRAGALPEFTPAERDRLMSLVDAAFERLEGEGLTGRSLFWQVERRKIRRDLERFVRRELDASRIEGTRPLELELGFGVEESFEISAGGRALAFRGRIDRVDIGGDGGLVVVDYKSGSSKSYGALKKAPLDAGRHLQLPIYAKAAAATFGAVVAGPVRSEYRFMSSEAAFDVIPVELTPMLDSALVETLTTLVSTAEAGTLPPNPGVASDASPGGLEMAGTNCRWCDFDSVCTADRVELWRRARGDPRLAAYVALTESGGAGS